MAKINKNIGIGKTLKNINKKYDRSNAHLGKNIMTKGNMINSARALMYSSHLDQYEPLDNPEVPRVSYGHENLVGEYSSGYHKTDTTLEVVAKINKFEIEGISDYASNLSYLLVVYDSEIDTYDVIKKTNFEKLTEDYGYRYNTDVLDSYEVGDVIPPNEVLMRSNSYDKCMNYRFGKNAYACHMVDTDTTEDGLKMRQGFAESFMSTKFDITRIAMNNNDILINLLGKGGEYKSFPDIGEKITSKILAAQRRLTYSTVLFDMKAENLSTPNYMIDQPFYAKEKGTIIDINVYCNKADISEIDDSIYNQQLLKYLKNDLRYHEEVVEVLSKFKKKGNAGDELNYHLKRSMEVLDPNTKWKDSNDSVFDNIIIEFNIMKPNVVRRGVKFTGRAGNKGVIATIVPDDEMPIVEETGRPLDVVINGLGPFGRLMSQPLYEVEVNFITDRVRDLYILPCKDFEERKRILFEILIDLVPDYGTRFKDKFNSYNMEHQEALMDEILEEGIRVEEPPFWDNITLDVLTAVYRKWDIPKYHLYTYRYGRKVKILNTHVVGDLYMIKLKHTPSSKFSARSTAQVSSLDLPEKTSVTKNNKALYSCAPVRLGEMELQNLMISNDIDFVKSLFMAMSSSIQARRNVGDLYTEDVFDFEEIKIDDECTNRNVEVLKVKLAAMGIDLVFKNKATGEIVDK